MQRYMKIRRYIGYLILILMPLLGILFITITSSIPINDARYFYCFEEGAAKEICFEGNIRRGENPNIVKNLLVMVALLCTFVASGSSLVRFKRKISNDEVTMVIMDGVSLLTSLICVSMSIALFFLLSYSNHFHVVASSINIFVLSINLVSAFIY